MTEPMIKAPLPPDMNESNFKTEAVQVQPPAPESSQPVADTPLEQPSEQTGEPAWKKNLKDLQEKAATFKEKAIPRFWYVIGGVFLIGFIFGSILSGGDSGSAPTTPSAKLPVIANEDIHQPLKPCGVANNREYCFLYLMNNYPSEKRVDDFIQRAYEITGRHPYEIRPENPIYVQTRIPPGYLMKIIIPPLK